MYAIVTRHRGLLPNEKNLAEEKLDRRLWFTTRLRDPSCRCRGRCSAAAVAAAVDSRLSEPRKRVTDWCLLRRWLRYCLGYAARFAASGASPAPRASACAIWLGGFWTRPENRNDGKSSLWMACLKSKFSVSCITVFVWIQGWVLA